MLVKDDGGLELTRDEAELMLKMASEGRGVISDRESLYGVSGEDYEPPQMEAARQLYDTLAEGPYKSLKLVYGKDIW